MKKALTVSIPVGLIIATLYIIIGHEYGWKLLTTTHFTLGVCAFIICYAIDEYFSLIECIICIFFGGLSFALYVFLLIYDLNDSAEDAIALAQERRR